MKIKWLVNTKLNIVRNTENTYTASIIAGETERIDVINENKELVDIQFEDGSVSFGVPKKYFFEVK